MPAHGLRSHLQWYHQYTVFLLVGNWSLDLNLLCSVKFISPISPTNQQRRPPSEILLVCLAASGTLAKIWQFRHLPQVYQMSAPNSNAISTVFTRKPRSPSQSSTSSSSRTTSSQHPLPPRTDWVVKLKPDPPLLPTSPATLRKGVHLPSRRA